MQAFSKIFGSAQISVVEASSIFVMKCFLGFRKGVVARIHREGGCSIPPAAAGSCAGWRAEVSSLGLPGTTWLYLGLPGSSVLPAGVILQAC